MGMPSSLRSNDNTTSVEEKSFGVVVNGVDVGGHSSSSDLWDTDNEVVEEKIAAGGINVPQLETDEKIEEKIGENIAEMTNNNKSGAAAAGGSNSVKDGKRAYDAEKKKSREQNKAETAPSSSSGKKNAAISERMKKYDQAKNSQKEKPISQPIHVISDIGNIKSRFDASKDSKFVAVKVQEDTQKAVHSVSNLMNRFNQKQKPVPSKGPSFGGRKSSKSRPKSGVFDQSTMLSLMENVFTQVADQQQQQKQQQQQQKLQSEVKPIEMPQQLLQDHQQQQQQQRNHENKQENKLDVSEPKKSNEKPLQPPQQPQQPQPPQQPQQPDGPTDLQKETGPKVTTDAGSRVKKKEEEKSEETTEQVVKETSVDSAPCKPDEDGEKNKKQ